jgi:hypothetical protein
MLQLGAAVLGAKARVFLNHQRARADLAAKRAAIGEHFRGSDPTAQAGKVKELEGKRSRRDLKQEVTLLLVLIAGQETIVLLQARSAGCEGGFFV